MTDKQTIAMELVKGMLASSPLYSLFTSTAEPAVMDEANKAIMDRYIAAADYAADQILAL
jgi:hypothetical protein